ncbi:MAG: hypothetical protein Q8830_02910, partial [Candidatus Phytoplasma australasiaticum]|nr:hypothetical protein [Candidatus Phytoplasma australasiaticum]
FIKNKDINCFEEIIPASIELKELAYPIKKFQQGYYVQSTIKDNNVVLWEEFKSAFLNQIFLLELRKAKMVEFMNLKQGSLSVREYALKFNQLSKYAPH